MQTTRQQILKTILNGTKSGTLKSYDVAIIQKAMAENATTNTTIPTNTNITLEIQSKITIVFMKC